MTKGSTYLFQFATSLLMIVTALASNASAAPTEACEKLPNGQSILKLVGIKAKGPFSKFADVEELEQFNAGTAFLIRTTIGKYWITAAHVVAPSKNANGDLFLLDPAQSCIKFDLVKELLATLDNGATRIPQASVFQDETVRYDSRLIGDFSFFATPAKFTKSVALEVRDLRRSPLALGEKVQVVGRKMNEMESTRIECRYLGLYGEVFLLGGLQMLLDCENVPTTPSGVALANVSGGPVMDAAGSAVGVFNGFINRGDELGRKKLFLRSAPIYLHADEPPRIIPLLEESERVSFPCLWVDNKNTITQILNGSAPKAQSCVLSRSKDSAVFSFGE